MCNLFIESRYHPHHLHLLLLMIKLSIISSPIDWLSVINRTLGDNNWYVTREMAQWWQCHVWPGPWHMSTLIAHMTHATHAASVRFNDIISSSHRDTCIDAAVVPNTVNHSGCIYAREKKSVSLRKWFDKTLDIHLTFLLRMKNIFVYIIYWRTTTTLT